jgi:hypothetical protein
MVEGTIGMNTQRLNFGATTDTDTNVEAVANADDPPAADDTKAVMTREPDAPQPSNAAPEQPAARAERLEQEIEEIRDHLGGLVTELDHRRHRLSPAAIIRRNKWPLAIGGAILVGAAVGSMVWRHARAQPTLSLVDRSKRLGADARAYLGRAGDKPRAVTVEPPRIGMKILTAAATAVAAVAARRLATRFFARTS